ncbi:hypothetical protein C5167_016544 [Papaver somniferum]|nr:hypothetical protein C5167_016544 [Papaver somniferum]
MENVEDKIQLQRVEYKSMSFDEYGTTSYMNYLEWSQSSSITRKVVRYSCRNCSGNVSPPYKEFTDAHAL